MEKDENKEPEDKLRPEEDSNAKDLPYDPNITDEDKQALPEEGLSMNQDRDRFLAERDRPVDFTADDLDIPDRELADTTQTGKDIPDEENQQFNMRGIRNEEDKRKDDENDLINEKTREDEEKEDKNIEDRS